MHSIRTWLKTLKHWPLVGVLWWCIFVLMASLAYVVVGINLLTAWVILGGSFALTAWVSRWAAFDEGGVEKKEDRELSVRGAGPSYVAASLVGVLQLCMAWMLWSGRQGMPLQSPWETVSWWFFVIYGFEVLVLWYLGARCVMGRLYSLIVTGHFALTYGIAAVVFALGYGYDPLIHQTAELYTVQYGRITPIQPYYIGQYAVVAALHFFSGLSVEWLDRLLLPVLTAISLPPLLTVAFRRSGLTIVSTRLAVLLVSVVSFAALTFTVPYNLSVLYCMWWLACLYTLRQTGSLLVSLILIAATATITHPLIGVPLMIGTVAAILLSHARTRWLQWSVVLASAFSIVAAITCMFSLYRHEAGLASLANMDFWKNSNEFVRQLGPVFATTTSWTPLLVLYWVEYLSFFAVIVGGVWWLIRSRKSSVVVGGVTVALALGLLGAMYMLITAIRLPGIAEYEQLEFALRLKQLLPILFVMPCCLAVASWGKRGWREVVMVCLAVCFLPLSLYMTYPQVNSIGPVPGYNVSKSDIDAVRMIEQDSRGVRYGVLTDHILAGVGLRELGFERTVRTPQGKQTHIYPLSPNEYLYAPSDYLLYYEANREQLNALMFDLGLPRLYIAVHAYWYRAPQIKEELGALGARLVSDDGRVSVFMVGSVVQ